MSWFEQVLPLLTWQEDSLAPLSVSVVPRPELRRKSPSPALLLLPEKLVDLAREPLHTQVPPDASSQ